MGKFLTTYFTAVLMAVSGAGVPLAAQDSSETAEEKLPDFSIPRRTVKAFFTAPDSLHVRRIYRSLRRRAVTEVDSIGSAVPVRKAAFQKVSGYFWKLYRTHQGGSSCPFEPRVRLCFFWRADTLTADVCFQCDDIDLKHRDKVTRLSFYDWRSTEYEKTAANAARLERDLLHLLTPLFSADSTGGISKVDLTK